MTKLKTQPKQIILLFLQIGFYAFFFYFIADALSRSWKDLPKHIHEINYFYIFVSLILFTFSLFILSDGWLLILRTLKENLPANRHYSIYFYPKLTTYAPGGIWFILGRIHLAEKSGVPKIKTLVSLGLELIFVVASGNILFLFSHFYNGKFNILLTFFSLFLFLLSILFLSPPVFNGILNFVLKLGREKPLGKKIKFKEILIILLLHLLYWVLGGISFYILIRSIYFIPLTLKMIVTLIGIFSVAWIVGILVPFVAGGLGVTEVIMLGLLSVIFPLSIASLVPILNRVVSIISDVTSVALVWVYNRFSST